MQFSGCDVKFLTATEQVGTPSNPGSAGRQRGLQGALQQMERCSQVIGVSWWPVFPVDWDDWSSGQSSQKLGGTDTSGLLSPLQPN